MPPEATHVAGTLFLYEDRLHIVAGRFEALHRRRKKGEPPAPLPKHRAAKVAAVHGKARQALREAPGSAIARAVRSGKLTVAAVERALSTPSARRAQPHGDDARRLALPVTRAASKDGAS